MTIEFFRKSLGAIIKVARLQRGMTQEALAEASGVKRRFIQRLENGYQETSLSTFFALAQALDVSPLLLMEELKYAIQHGCLEETIEKELPPKMLGRPQKKGSSG
jgi:HTH-type transcriptional regulator/antitoxin HipB